MVISIPVFSVEGQLVVFSKDVYKIYVLVFSNYILTFSYTASSTTDIPDVTDNLHNIQFNRIHLSVGRWRTQKHSLITFFDYIHFVM